MVQLADCDPTYEIKYGLRGRGAETSSAPITQAAWERVLDNPSRATITHMVTGPDCCEELGRLEPWADTVTFYRNGEVVWYGWLNQVTYGRGTVTVKAVDALGWLSKRILHDDYNETADQARHFENFWHLAMDISPVNAQLEIYDTGVQDTRKSKFTDLRYGWAAVSEMLDLALDITVLGPVIHAGTLTIAKPIQLTLNDFEGDVAITKDGDAFADSAWFDAAGSIVGHYPNNKEFAGNGYYPLVETVIRDGMVTDQVSANAGAKSRVDLSPIVPRIVKAGDALTLKKSAPVTVRGLVPSAVVALDTEGLCYAQKEYYRLNKVSADIQGSVEKMSITLQPVGTVSELQNFGGDDAPFTGE